MTKKAFTLLELSLVVLIISILVVGSMSASITTINKAKYKTTKERLDGIYKALGNYFVMNGSFPCPGVITLPDTDTSYGVTGGSAGVCASAGAGSGDIVYGMVPIQALGLPVEMAKDGFGTKFTYVINKNFTDPSNGVFVGNSLGDLDIVEVTSAGSQPITSEAMFILISHGQNKFGGYNANATTQNSPTSGDNSEKDNYQISTNDDFVAKSINSEDFDDVLFFKTRNQMIMDFDALEKISCAQLTESYSRCDDGASGNNCIWPESGYNQVVTTSTGVCDSTHDTTVAKPTKRCGAFGVWDSGYVNPCTE